MCVITLAEGTGLGLSEWASRLGLDRTDLESIIDAKVLRPTDQGDYILALVGIVVFKDRVLFGQPKFDTGTTFDLPRTLQILRAYFSRSQLRKPVIDHRRDPEYGDLQVLREFDALIGLRDWFGVHGLYRREHSRASNTGRPHWVRTIAKRIPLAMQGEMIYPALIAERREGVLNDISSLQVGILGRLMERYGFPMAPAVRHAELATGSVVDRWPLRADTKAYYQRRLAREQRDVFRTDALHLLNLLRGVLDTRLSEATAQPQIFGTTAFHAVWEDACRVGIGCDFSTKSVAALSPPAWFTPDAAGHKCVHTHAQIPDFMFIREPWLFIIDAKYYYPFPAARPGGPDIIKQVYYAESLQHSRPQVCSLFLLPLPGAFPPRFLGYATIDGSQRAFTNVEAWGIDPDWLFADYPLVSTDRANRVIDVILSIRDTVAEFVRQAPADVSC